MSIRQLCVAGVFGCVALLRSVPASAQDELPVEPEEVVASGLPIFATLGFAFGQRSDGCVLCEDPQDDSGFGAHLSVGKYLAHRIGVGVDASVWRRNRPAGFSLADEAGEEAPATLSNMLSNASLVFSFERWNAFVRAGGGLAWGSQDWVEESEEGEPAVVSMSGMGIGYTVGVGITLPLHPMVALAFFGNFNVGLYDLSSPSGSVFRDATHEILEFGIGVSLR